MLHLKSYSTKSFSHICNSPLLVYNVESLFHLVFPLLHNTHERLERSP